MIFEFKDKRNWTYQFEIDEDDLACVMVLSIDEQGRQVHREYIAFCEEVFSWQDWHTRKECPLVSLEAREFCEKSVISFMKMRVFW